MRIAAVYNVWGDCLDLLEKSVNNILPVVDHVIIVASRMSNWGNPIDYSLEPSPKITVHWLEPDLHKRPGENESIKRAFGLQKAREMGMTHFVGLDSDEFYDRDEFAAEAERIDRMGIEGTVCRTQVYFKEPTLTLPDHTLVPFIHKINHYLRYKLDSQRYPFAYDEMHLAHIDPTRRFNLTEGVEMSPIMCHHFSWVRKDFNLKIENSTARNNIRRSTILKDLENAREGYFVEAFYKAKLQKCENKFGI